MQTISIKNSDLNKIIKNSTEVPVIIQNEDGMNYLLMPFQPEKWQDILILFYNSVNEIQNMQKLSQSAKKGKAFTEKWRGFLKDSDITDNYKDEYYKYIKKKYE